MSWITIILLIIQYGPTLLALAKKIWDLIHGSSVSAADRPDLLVRLSNLIRLRDRAGIEAMMAELQATAAKSPKA